MIKTKIIATLGPSCNKPDIIESMIDNGVDIFRLNFSHGTFDWHAQSLKTLNAVRNLASSWLSREVLVTGILTAVVCLLAILNMLGAVFQGPVIFLEWAAAILSLALIFCMSNIYRLRTVPVWNSIRTSAKWSGSAEGCR